MNSTPEELRGELARIVSDMKNALSASSALGLRHLVAGRPEKTPASPSGDAAAELVRIREDLGDCKRCALHNTRTQIVFGVGDPRADLVFVGEAPGRDEDLQGEPFVGRAGQLLTKMISAMGYSRKQVYIANIIKCRPPQNRNPEPDEIISCEPFLIRQLGAIHPKVICALGKFAAQTLLRTEEKISSLRGRWFEYQGIRIIATYHPAYLLRNPDEKRIVWDDLKKIMTALGDKP